MKILVDICMGDAFELTNITVLSYQEFVDSYSPVWCNREAAYSAACSGVLMRLIEFVLECPSKTDITLTSPPYAMTVGASGI